MSIPIILNNFGDVLVFDSVEKAVRYIEPIDVSNNEYTGYDGEGRLLQLSVLNDTRIVIGLAENEPNHKDELYNVLIDFLARIGIAQEWLKQASLEDLVMKSLEYKTE
jgi:hypothetical protein